MCTEGRKIKYSRNAIRIKDGDIDMKRDNGDVVKYIAQ